MFDDESIDALSREELVERVKLQEVQIEVLQRTIERLSSAPPVEDATTKEVIAAFRKMTTKQHGAMQMLLNGASNLDIAGRFDVAESTAKVHVRGFMGHIGVHNRIDAAMKVKSVFENMSDEDYAKLSGGLPIDWHVNYVKYIDDHSKYFGKRE